MPTIDAFWAFAGQFGLTLVVAVGAAWGAFRYLGDKWITNKFDERLEAFKHVQQQELEGQRLQINTMFDRTVKLHANEFETLPEMLNLLTVAFHSTRNFTSDFRRIANLDAMDIQELTYFLDQQDLPDHQFNKILSSKTKNDDFEDIAFWKRNWACSEDCRAFTRYLAVKGIFVGGAIKPMLNEMEDMLWKAIHETEFHKRHPSTERNSFTRREALADHGEEKLKAIEAAIHDRLWAGASVRSWNEA